MNPFLPVLRVIQSACAPGGLDDFLARAVRNNCSIVITPTVILKKGEYVGQIRVEAQGKGAPRPFTQDAGPLSLFAAEKPTLQDITEGAEHQARLLQGKWRREHTHLEVELAPTKVG